MLLPFLILCAPAWSQAEQVQATATIDRVMVVVGQRVITDSDVQLSIALDDRDSAKVPALSGAAPDPVDRLINRRILYDIAGKIRVYQPTETEVRARMARLMEQWVLLSERRKFMQRYGLDEERLRRALAERMVVERYIERNLPSKDGVPITLTEFHQWMAKHRAGVRIRTVAKSESQP